MPNVAGVLIASESPFLTVTSPVVPSSPERRREPAHMTGPEVLRDPGAVLGPQLSAQHETLIGRCSPALPAAPQRSEGESLKSNRWFFFTILTHPTHLATTTLPAAVARAARPAPARHPLAHRRVSDKQILENMSLLIW